MASLLRLAAKLVPFATPGTPLLQDLLYTAALAACVAVVLYERAQAAQRQREAESETGVGAGEVVEHIEEQQPRDEAPRDDGRQVFFFDEGNGQDGGQDGPAAGNAPLPAEVHDLNDDDEDDDSNAGEGPANQDPNRPLPPQRAVGAKKAKSLARKDQRRAYQEFLRSQGEAQRARDAEGAAEREALLAAEREKRAAREAAIEAKRAREREERKVAETRAREWEARRRTEPVEVVRRELAERGRSDLWRLVKEMKELDLDVEFIEKLLVLAGVIRKGVAADGSLTMLTSKGWVVRVTGEDMRRVYELVAKSEPAVQDGRVGLAQVAVVAQRVLEGKA